MVQIGFPDGRIEIFDRPPTGIGIAKSISPSLAKRSVALVVDGVVRDLSSTIEHDATIEFIDRKHPRALELIRHDCAHVLAEAVQELYPDILVTIGPVIADGFYYDFFCSRPLTRDDLPKIEQRMREIIKRNEPFTFETWTREDTRKYFEKKGETFKVDLLQAIPEGEALTIYRQGKWLDLCRGPHMTSTGDIGSAFSLTHTAGSYWRGKAENPQLSRIYGTAWADETELETYLFRRQEAEKRDHRRLGRALDLYHFQPEAPGSVFWHPKGWHVFCALRALIQRRMQQANYQEVNTPDMMDRSLWEASGHWEKYQENMFLVHGDDDRCLALKPMNCPGHVQVFNRATRSYRDLPLMYSEFGKVHRNEASGALHGLMRVRSFTQDDAHVFISVDQIERECVRINEFMLTLYRDFGFEDVHIMFSDRPEVRVGSDEVWDQAEAALMNAIKVAGISWSRNPGDGAFYGPKLDYVLRDAIGREWQCGTVQVDFNLPRRLGATYVGKDGDRHVPVMLHQAVLGSLERFTGILVEHYGGAFPVWLAPVQIVVCIITDAGLEYGRSVEVALRSRGLRATLDSRNESITYKIREHSHAKVPVLAIIGEREAASDRVSVRRFGSRAQEAMDLDEFYSSMEVEALSPDLRNGELSSLTSG